MKNSLITVDAILSTILNKVPTDLWLQIQQYIGASSHLSQKCLILERVFLSFQIAHHWNVVGFAKRESARKALEEQVATQIAIRNRNIYLQRSQVIQCLNCLILWQLEQQRKQQELCLNPFLFGQGVTKSSSFESYYSSQCSIRSAERYLEMKSSSSRQSRYKLYETMFGKPCQVQSSKSVQSRPSKFPKRREFVYSYSHRR